MGKILGSWSGMRKYLEQEMLAEPLRGRVRYGCTRYVGMDNCHIFDIAVDVFAVLDRRVGKRTLEKLNDGITDKPEWLGYFCDLRANSENIKTQKGENI